MSRRESVIGYTRAGARISVAEEQAVIAAACRTHGWKLVRVEADQAGEGKRSRPALARALEGQALLLASLDRAARSLSEAAQLLERARSEDWNLVALDLGLDLSTPAGRRIANAFTTAAAWERRLRSERTRAALARTRAQGKTLDAAES